MFPQKISQNIDILAKIHGNVFPWQPAIMGNKASFHKSIFQISLPWLHLFFYNACPRYPKSRRDLLYIDKNFSAEYKRTPSLSISGIYRAQWNNAFTYYAHLPFVFAFHNLGDLLNHLASKCVSQPSHFFRGKMIDTGNPRRRQRCQLKWRHGTLGHDQRHS